MNPVKALAAVAECSVSKKNDREVILASSLGWVEEATTLPSDTCTQILAILMPLCRSVTRDRGAAAMVAAESDRRQIRYLFCGCERINNNQSIGVEIA
jgi:hypothetical protein